MRQTNYNEKVTFSIVGAGNRAGAYIEMLERHYKNQYDVVAVFDPDSVQQEKYRSQYKLKDNQIFNSLDDFLKMPRLSDVVIIATLDTQHYEPTIKALEKGYDIILEKPISLNLEETIEIGKLGEQFPNQLVAVCHVLRHSPFFRKIKEVIDSRVLGNVVNIQHNENIGYYHFAHSYVRGNWRNTDVAAPIIVAKSCHDMDILLYLLGDKHCTRISSMGSLNYFHKKNIDKCKDEGPYSAEAIYGSDKIRSVVFDNSSAERLKNELEDSPYGRCVFDCDNNVVDHQVTILEFDGGVHATFNLSAFTNTIHRSLKVMCELGEIRATEATNEIEVWPFGGEKQTFRIEKGYGGHGGSDEGFVKNFMETYLYNKPFDSTLSMSIESHVMAFAAEESRVNHGRLINVKRYYNKLLKGLEK